ncbi:MAG: DsbA family oxidoreductase [Xanthomonadales bacterium]|nr:DsbA family oxidoreductase [Xanthomonadales bacterium]
MNTVEIEIWSDIACPWCWVGKRSLEQAIERSPHPVSLRWRAFELNPQAPMEAPEQVDYAARLAEKYGKTRAEGEGFIARMVQAGRDRGLDLRFDRIRPSNTFDAHRLLALAHEQGVQSELKERLFRAYLHEGRAISDHATLRALGVECGLAEEQVQSLLSGNAFADEVRADEELARRMGISGVPCFVFPQLREGVSGAQPPEVLGEAIARAAEYVTGGRSTA